MMRNACNVLFYMATLAHAGSEHSTRALAPPIIDIAPLVNPELYTAEAVSRVQNAIRDASGTWGFFQVLNHGIPDDLQVELMEQMKTFFGSDQDIKYTIRRTENNSRGFADDELTKRLKDVKEIVDIGQVPYSDISDAALANQEVDGFNQWPDTALYPHLQQFKPVADRYYDASLQLSRTLAAALAASIPCANETYFSSAFDHHSSFLRLNYYPVLIDGVDAGATPTNGAIESVTGGQPGSSRRLGVSRHTDAGALTILLQDWNPDVTSGLEVVLRS
jgi:isopenicillin N synthase-like dioxygenase